MPLKVDDCISFEIVHNQNLTVQPKQRSPGDNLLNAIQSTTSKNGKIAISYRKSRKPKNIDIHDEARIKEEKENYSGKKVSEKTTNLPRASSSI